jgi:LTXXQ motif family protein
MNKSILAGAALIAAAAVAVPVMAWSDDNPNSAPQAGQGQDGHGHGGMWRHEGMRADMRGEMHGEGRWGENRSPQQKCEEHLARRAGFVAYIGARLNLTAEQKPLWDKVQAATQAAQDKQRQVCGALKPAAERGQETMLDRMGRREQMLSAKLQGLQQVEPALQALYQSLTPEQKAIVDHPFRRG